MSEHEQAPTDTASRGMGFWGGVSAVIISMLLLGWYFAQERKTSTVATAEVECAPIPAGMSWNGSSLVPYETNIVEATPIPETPATPTIDWTRPIEASFAPLGYDWMKLNLQDNDTVQVSGTAPSRDAKHEGFDIATRAVKAADNGAHSDARMINRIDIVQGRSEWADDMNTSLKGLGFDWLDFSVRGPVATLSGTAPTAEAREEAFRMAELAVSRNPLASGQIERVVNGITVEGEDESAAEALVELSNTGDEGLTVDACSAAFAKTMQGRNIQFETESAEISAESARLLDALTGIAILCVNSNGHTVEVAGHTDASGAAAYNQDLSKRRAESVRAYLVRNGVDAVQLNAVGYGSTELLANLPENDPLHRRTEFRVTATE